MSLYRSPEQTNATCGIRHPGSDLVWFHPYGFENCVKTLADCFSYENGGNLKRLHLKVSVYIGRLRKGTDELCKALQWNLDPLRESIRGLSEFRFEIGEAYGMEPGDMSIIEDFLDAVGQEMLQEIPEETEPEVWEASLEDWRESQDWY